VDAELIAVLDDLREFLKAPILIHSGCRCDKRNEEVKGKPRSYHIRGRAADISSSAAAPYTIYAYLDYKYPGRYGLKLYTMFVHIDTRAGSWRE